MFRQWRVCPPAEARSLAAGALNETCCAAAGADGHDRFMNAARSIGVHLHELHHPVARLCCSPLRI